MSFVVYCSLLFALQLLLLLLVEGSTSTKRATVYTTSCDRNMAEHAADGHMLAGTKLPGACRRMQVRT
uniref:Putative secreted protein n=1 Tax=Anopheles darlingi TaxID=43151 RepID=A0A2M4D641_ANODA